MRLIDSRNVSFRFNDHRWVAGRSRPKCGNLIFVLSGASNPDHRHLLSNVEIARSVPCRRLCRARHRLAGIIRRRLDCHCRLPDFCETPYATTVCLLSHFDGHCRTLYFWFLTKDQQWLAANPTLCMSMTPGSEGKMACFTSMS